MKGSGLLIVGLSLLAVCVAEIPKDAEKKEPGSDRRSKRKPIFKYALKIDLIEFFLLSVLPIFQVVNFPVS